MLLKPPTSSLIQIRSIKHNLISIRSNRKFHQFSSLFAATFISIPVGILVNVILTRLLVPSAYGDYMLINSMFSVCIILGSFGFLQAGTRTIILNDEEIIRKEFYGTQFVLSVLITCLLFILFLAYIYFDNNIGGKGLRHTLILLSPFGIWIFYMIRYFEVLLPSDNSIELLSKTRLYPKLVFLLFLLTFYFIFKYAELKVSVLFIMYSFFLSRLIIYFNALRKLHIKFTNLTTRIKETWLYNKEFGLNIYLGSIVAIGFAQLTSILISYFDSTNSGVAFYSLAISFSSPLTLFPNIIASIYYKDFAKTRKITTKVFIVTFLLSIACLLLILIITPFFVHFFYGLTYSPSIRLTYIVSFGAILYGFGDFFNKFFSAHGKGKIIRNIAITVGVIILIANILLVPFAHEVGASFVYVIGGLSYFILMIYFYIKIFIYSK